EPRLGLCPYYVGRIKQPDTGGISSTTLPARDLKKCMELKRVYLHEQLLKVNMRKDNEGRVHERENS
ncbi:hypothetical protein ACPEHS_01820, partial [Escherichia coli]